MSKIIVKKFGGTSLKDIECINKVAKIIQNDVINNYKVIVVVSAMGTFTNDIISKIKLLSDLCTASALAEYDSIIASGEQISSGLLSIALQKMNIKARSWLGWQIPIKTSSHYSNARIVEVEDTELKNFLKDNDVAIIAGFQGVYNNRITTLGRGGSDTSAVAIAAALKLDLCYIYTDVDGIYTTDPNTVPTARKVNNITYDEMLEMSSLGAKILQVRSVEIAMRYNIKLCVLSTFAKTQGTFVVRKEEIMESHTITGITLHNNAVSITVESINTLTGIAAVFAPLAQNNISVDMIIQNIGHEKINVTFTISEDHIARTTALLTELKDQIMYNNLIINPTVAEVSIIGVGMISNPGVAYKMFNTLSNNKIKILAVTTSEIKISVLIERIHSALAIKVLHDAFELHINKELK
ncbi:aspartate kinase [Neoehrlichia mikurensis]|uniref:Aspartokinase n=1 Tax=Neoehrlichia mikurensis TaxID=89586 RepID=A0ABY5F0P5_9RICK|nr:aspartate kinase [Neoehrlichia mikurensis]UTO56610.1 aspartate kinase [Neoehrlichia mikurensis]